MKYLLDFCLKHIVFTLLLFLGVFAFGVYSFFSLKVEFLSKVEVPIITVQTNYPFGGPDEIDRLITKKIEDAVSTIDGLKAMKSVSEDGHSLVKIFLDWGYDVDRAIVDVRKNIELIKNSLPENTQDSLIMRGAIQPKSTVVIALENKAYNDLELKEEIDKKLKVRFQHIEGSAKMDVEGLDELYVKVLFKQRQLEEYKLSIDGVSSLLKNSNLIYPVGYVHQEGKEFSVKVDNEYHSIDEIKKIQIPIDKEGRKVFLGEIATIDYGQKRQTGYNRIDEKKGILLDVFKESEFNTVVFGQSVEELVKELNENYKGKMVLKVLYNEKDYIQEAMRSLLINIIVGVFVGFGVLYFFYRNMVLSGLILLSILFSFSMTFLCMYIFDLSINLLTMGAMAVGSGMILDASVVVLDKMMKPIDGGGDLRIRIVHLLKEVVPTIMSSAISTIIVFLPIFLIKSFISTLFWKFCLILVVVVINSVIYSLIFLPVLFYVLKTRTSLTLDNLTQNTENSLLRRILVMGEWYRQKKSRLIWSYVFIVLSTLSFWLIRKELFPVVDVGKLTIKGEFPLSTALEKTQKAEEDVVRYLLKLKEENESVYTRVGKEKRTFMDFDNSNEENLFYVTYVYDDRPSMGRLEDKLHQLEGQYPGLRLNVEREYPDFIQSFFSSKEMENVIIVGEDRQALEEWIEKKHGDEKAYNYKKGMFYQIVPGLLSQYDMDMLSVAKELKSRLYGDSGNRIYNDDTDTPVLFDIWEDEKQNVETMGFLNANGIFHRMKDFTTMEERWYKNREYRFNGQPMEYLLKEDFEGVVEEKGIFFQKNNYDKEVEYSIRDFIISFFFCLFLIYMVIATQFNSFKKPIFMLGSIYPAITFSVIFLMFLGQSLNVFSLIAIILLSGTVINNAILVYEELYKEVAIREVVTTRFFPVIITSATTIFTLFPLIVFSDRAGQYNQIISIVLLGGFVVSIFISLVLIPAHYYFYQKDK